MYNSPSLQINESSYQNPILYAEYINGVLYIIHPDKKIALNIPETQYQNFINTLIQETENKLNKKWYFIHLKSYELLAKETDLKTKKHRQNLLPQAIFFIPSKVTTPTSNVELEIEKPVSFTPTQNRLHIDYPKETKINFINRIQHLQRKLDTKSDINFKFTSHSKLNNLDILNQIYPNFSSTNSPDKMIFQNPDYSIISQLSALQKPNPNSQNSILTEKHPRSFQRSSLHINTPDNLYSYTLIDPFEIIQENIIHNLLLSVSPKTKAFSLFQKLQQQIRKIS